MNDAPRQKLRDLIQHYGRDICNDPNKCKALLLDYCSEHKRELNVLVTALQERVASDLLNSSSSVPVETTLAKLTQRLVDNQAMANDAARWAVESWALALGVSSTAPVSPPPAVPPSLPSISTTQFPLILGHTKEVFCIAFSPDGKILASGGNDKTIRLWDIATGRLVHQLANHGKVCDIAFNPNGSMLAALCNETMGCYYGSIKRWDLANWDELKNLPKRIFYSSLYFSPDGRVLAAGSSGKLYIWDTISDQMLMRLDLENFLRDFVNGASQRIVNVAFGVNSVILACSYYKFLNLWEISANLKLYDLNGHNDTITSVDFGFEGRLLASSSKDRNIRIWDVATGICKNVLQGHTNWVNSVAFSPDGTLLASGSNDKTIGLWDVAHGNKLHELRGHTGWVLDVAFSPDGCLLASASHDKTVRLWNIGMSEAEWAALERDWRAAR